MPPPKRGQASNRVEGSPRRAVEQVVALRRERSLDFARDDEDYVEAAE